MAEDVRASDGPDDEVDGPEDESVTEEPEEFLNRAARRAKGKKSGQSGALAAGAAQPHGRGVVENRRQQYGSRRTG